MGNTSGFTFLKSTAPHHHHESHNLQLLFVVGAQALPQLLPHPALYHAPANRTTEYVTITTKNCLPKADRECEDVEVPQQKIELVDNCSTIEVQVCGLEPVEEEADDAENAVEVEGDERKRREAEADPVLLYGAPHPYHVAPLLKHSCEMKEQEYCFKEPKVVEETATLKKCMFKHTVECEDVENKIPKVVCAGAAPLPAPVPVF